jgi:Phospholipase_D-nuclease N-terminal
VSDTQILLLVLPILVIELVLIVVALRDLLRPERRVRGDSKLMWGLLIVFISLLGPILYLTVGRQEE